MLKFDKLFEKKSTEEEMFKKLLKKFKVSDIDELPNDDKNKFFKELEKEIKQ